MYNDRFSIFGEKRFNSLMSAILSSSEKQLGRVVLGSFMFARGKELDHWNEMLSKERDQVSHWHVLT